MEAPNLGRPPDNCSDGVHHWDEPVYTSIELGIKVPGQCSFLPNSDGRAVTFL